jgi:CheY-like chemotaxis protein
MKYKILVVDDNEMNLTLIAKILELEGYQVKAVQNGLDAIDAVSQNPPDMAVLDVMMPDMDGYTLCEKLRQPPLKAIFPIIMLTAMNSEFEKDRADAAGANEMWSKPFDIELFRRRIQELLAAGQPGGEVTK